MKKDTPPGDPIPSSLRQRAEEQLQAQEQAEIATPHSAFPDPHSEHELRVHQIELEMQNEELRRAQVELTASQARYFDLYDMAPVGYLTLSDNGMIVQGNLTAVTLLGETRRALVNQRFSQFIFKEDQDTYYLFLKQLLKTGVQQTCELRLANKNGTRFWAQLTANTAPDEDGARRCFIVFNDISARKQTEKLLAVQSEVLTVLAASIPLQETVDQIVAAIKKAIGFDAVGLRLSEGDDYPFLSAQGYTDEFLQAENTLTVRYPNGGVCRNEDGSINLECTCGLVLTGKTDPANPLFSPGGSAWTNNSLPLLDVPSDQDPRLHPRNRCIHAGFMSIAIVPLRAGDDEIVGLLHLADHRKDCLTPALIRFFEGVSTSMGMALRHRKVEAEREKLQTQLAHAQKTEAVGRLAGGVAHDFNNMLMGILNYAELCRDKLEPDHPIREWLNEITVDAERSAKLTHQLLAFARKQVIAPKVIDLNEAIGSMLNLLRRLIGEDIAINWRPGIVTWPVKIDPIQIDQILTNLAINTRDAIGGVGSISIETGNVTFDAAYCADHADVRPGNYALLTVSDSGCGMDQVTLENIFEPFFTTKGVGEGTGLGLATVYGIVKQNDGFINVYSEPGHGTTFKIYLPRVRAADAGQAVSVKTVKPAHGSETILLVEDEKSIRITTCLLLRKLGYTVLVAEDPQTALRLDAEHPGEIDLLLTDVIMPGMSGRDLANRLLELRPAIKRLFMSGFTADVIAQRGILEDGVNFLSKPFSRDTLARKVREVLDEGKE